MSYNTYDKDSLYKSFYSADNNVVDVENITVEECIKFAGERKWTVKKCRELNGEEIFVTHNSTIKKIFNAKGFIVVLGKDGKSIRGYMEDKRDAYLVCVLELMKKP